MIESFLLRFFFFVVAWLRPVASCIAWIPTTNRAHVRSKISVNFRNCNVWGLVNERGGAFGGNDEGNEPAYRVLVLMDVFCDFHGQYLSQVAREVYGVRCINVLSEYMANYLMLQQQTHQSLSENHSIEDGEGFDNNLPPLPRMPSSPEEAIEWQQDLTETLLNHQNSISKNYNSIEIKGLICESDPGLCDAERLSAWLNVTNHNGYNEARRNKFLTIDTLASKNIPTVQQQLCETVNEAISFAKDQFLSLSAGMVVVKPVRGCASDDVFLCDNLEAVRSAYQTIKGSTVLGSPTKKHESVLIQEYAVGQEYAIDTVSKDGKLKIAAVWKYDKRPQPPTIYQEHFEDHVMTASDGTRSSNDGIEQVHQSTRQVYYATKLYDDDDESNNEDNDPLLPMIYKYLDDCLNALGIRWGITHSELIITSEGPRLVEVNCRQHNMDFVPLTDNGIGYNLYDMFLAAYFGDDIDDFDVEPNLNMDARLNWDLIPDYPSTRMNAAMVHLVNDKKGVLKRLNEVALYEIQSMDSVFDLEVYPDFLEPGISVIEPTVDIKSDAGWIQMIHPDPEIFRRDYQRIMELMPTLFEI